MKEDFRILFYDWTSPALEISGVCAHTELRPREPVIEEILPEAMGRDQSDALDMLRQAVADQLDQNAELRIALDEHPTLRRSLEQFAHGSGQFQHHH